MLWICRVGEELFLYLGARLGYWRGDIKGLVDDIGELKPTIFIGVPRVFERIYTGVNAKVGESKIAGFLYRWGFKRKLYSLDQGHSFNHVSILPIENVSRRPCAEAPSGGCLCLAVLPNFYRSCFLCGKEPALCLQCPADKCTLCQG